MGDAYGQSKRRYQFRDRLSPGQHRSGTISHPMPSMFLSPIRWRGYGESRTMMTAPKQKIVEARIIPFLRPNRSTSGKVKREPKMHPTWNVDTILPDKVSSSCCGLPSKPKSRCGYLASERARREKKVRQTLNDTSACVPPMNAVSNLYHPPLA